MWMADKHEEMVGKSWTTDKVGEDVVHEHLPEEGSPVRGKVGFALVLESASYLGANL